MSSIPITIPASIRSRLSTLKLRVSTFDASGNIIFHSIDRDPVPVASLKIRVNGYDENGNLVLTDSVVVASELGDPRHGAESRAGTGMGNYGMVVLNGGDEEEEDGADDADVKQEDEEEEVEDDDQNGGDQEEDFVQYFIEDVAHEEDEAADEEEVADENDTDEEPEDSILHNSNIIEEDTMMTDQNINDSMHASRPSFQFQVNDSIVDEDDLEITDNFKRFRIPSRSPNPSASPSHSTTGDPTMPPPIPAFVSSAASNEILNCLLALQSSHIALRNSVMDHQSMVDKKLACSSEFIDEKFKSSTKQGRKMEERGTRMYRDIGTLNSQVNGLQHQEGEFKKDIEEIVVAVNSCIEDLRDTMKVVDVLREDVKEVKEEAEGIEAIVKENLGWIRTEMENKVNETDEVVREVRGQVRGHAEELVRLKAGFDRFKRGMPDEEERGSKRRKRN